MTSAPPRTHASVLEPSLFHPTAIDAETRAFNAQLAAVWATVPPVWSQPPAITRQLREEGKGPLGPIITSERAQTRTIPGPAGPITLRTIVPQTVTGVYLHLHGGGWTLGRPHHYDLTQESLATATNLASVSVDYRLAPEDPYPAGPDDCEAAALWLIQNAKEQFGTDHLVIGGDSAGANVTVATLLRLRDKHRIQPFSRANLIYGGYDLNQAPSVRNCPVDSLILNRESIEWFTNNYVPDGAIRRTPDVSPLWADLTGMPPALFTVGTLDPLVDDTLFMYARWIAAGNEAELAIYPGGIHGFVQMPFPLAQRANQRMHEFLASAR